jgi:hypothetical protein
MPPIMLMEEESLNLKVDLFLQKKFAILLWDMEDMYGTSKGCRWYSRTISTIKLDDFIQEFDTWCDM